MNIEPDRLEDRCAEHIAVNTDAIAFQIFFLGLSAAISLKRIADHVTRPAGDRKPDRLSYRMRKMLREIALGGEDGKPITANARNTTALALEERKLIKRAPDQPDPGLIAWQATLEGFEENARAR